MIHDGVRTPRGRAILGLIFEGRLLARYKTSYGEAGTFQQPVGMTYIGSQSVLAAILKPPYPLSIQRLVAPVMMASSSLIR